MIQKKTVRSRVKVCICSGVGAARILHVVFLKYPNDNIKKIKKKPGGCDSYNTPTGTV